MEPIPLQAIYEQSKTVYNLLLGHSGRITDTLSYAPVSQRCYFTSPGFAIR